jgi:uncharacterized membrane protein (UPF0127 family)
VPVESEPGAAVGVFQPSRARTHQRAPHLSGHRQSPRGCRQRSPSGDQSPGALTDGGHAYPRWVNGARVTIEGSGASLAKRIEVAGDSASRRRGLPGRDRLDPECGVVIAPSQAVHTFGMRFAIDIVAVARDGSVVKIRSHVPPRRIVMAWSAFAIIELPAGSADTARLQIGDRLRVVAPGSGNP